MLKKSIIGLLLLAIAMPAFAGNDVEKKILVGDWPVIYKMQKVCDQQIKVIMNVGYYVKIKDCKKLKIVMEQQSIKVYKGCVQFQIMSNFDLELGATVHPNAAGLQIAPASKWSAYIDGDNYLLATGDNYKKRTICVAVKDVKLIKGSPHKELEVAKASILVRPIATP